MEGSVLIKSSFLHHARLLAYSIRQITVGWTKVHYVKVCNIIGENWIHICFCSSWIFINLRSYSSIFHLDSCPQKTKEKVHQRRTLIFFFWIEFMTRLKFWRLESKGKKLKVCGASRVRADKPNMDLTWFLYFSAVVKLYKNCMVLQFIIM